MRFLLVLFYVGCAFTFGQQLYPFNKDGKWGLMDVDGQISLPPQYDYIQYQPAGDKFVFDKRGKFGVMDQTGSLLAKPFYQKIEYFTPVVSRRLLNDKWGLYVDTTLVGEAHYDSITFLQDDIYRLYKDKRVAFYDLSSRSLSSKTYIDYHIAHDMLLCTNKKDNYDLLSINDVILLQENLKDVEWGYGDYAKILFPDSSQMIHIKSQKVASPKFKKIQFEFLSWYLMSNGSKYYIYDIETKKQHEMIRCDQISDVWRSLVAYKKGKLYGIYDFEKKEVVMEPAYDGLAIKDGLIYTENGGRFGLSEIKGDEILPAEFDNIQDYGSVYVVKKDGKYGLRSRSGKEIEACDYKEIEVYDNNVKCYKRKELVTINIDGRGNVKDRTEYDSYMKVSFVKARRPRQSARDLDFGGNNNDNGRQQTDIERLKRLGWEQREMERTEGDCTYTVYGSWGLRDKEDSLRIRYFYRQIAEEPDDKNLTRAYRSRKVRHFGSKRSKQTCVRKKLFFKIGESIGYADGFYQLVDHRSYVRLSKNKFAYVNVKDWQNYALARGMTTVPVLIDSSGRIAIDSITHFGNYVEDKLRICVGGKYQSQRTFNRQKHHSTYNLFTNMGLRYSYVNWQYPYYSVEGGEWYFVDKNGNKLNEKPFQFAYEFKDNRAVVKRGGKWGVVDSNMVEIVPIEFKTLKEIWIDGKVYYEVSRGNRARYLYDHSEGSYSQTDVIPKKLRDYHNGRWFYDTKEGTVLIDTFLNPAPGSYKSIYGGYNDNRVVGDGETYRVMDKNFKVSSIEYAASDIRPIGHGRYLVQGEYNGAVVDKQGNYLIPKFMCNKIIANEPSYILYIDSRFNFSYWGELKIKPPKKTKILSANIPHKWLLVEKKGKKKIYNYEAGEYVKIDASGIQSLEEEGYIFQKERYGKKGLVSYQGDTILQPTYWDFIFDEKSWGIGKESSDKLVIIDKKGNKICDSIFSSIERGYIRNDRFMVTTISGLKGVINSKAEFILPCEYESIEVKAGQYYVVKEVDANTKKYLDMEGNLIKEIGFEATIGFPPSGFVNHGYDTRRKRAHRYFYDGYINRSMWFRDIFPLSSTTFIVEETTHHGMYSYEGDTIVPVQYHSLQLVRGKLQVRFFNSFGYYNPDGTTLLDPRVIKQ